MNSKAVVVVDTAAVVAIGQTHRKEQQSSAPDAVSKQPFLSNPVAIVRSFARPAIRRSPEDATQDARAAAGAADADATDSSLILKI
jgi:hypothetical protein